MKSVTAIMVTGHRPERRVFAEVAVRCFFKQRYRNKTLLILNTGASLQIADARAREILLSQGNLNLGDLRNLALDEASGEYVIQWDDDDWYYPDRIRQQMAHAHPEHACVLAEQIRHSFRSGRSFVARMEQGIDGTVLHRRCCGFTYPSMPKAEDTYFIQKFPGREIIHGKPHLYVRFYHGANTWHERKIMHRRGRPVGRWTRALLVRRVLPLYRSAITSTIPPEKELPSKTEEINRAGSEVAKVS